MREIAETDVVGDRGDRRAGVEQQRRRRHQTPPYQILMWRHADRRRERAQEMKRARTGDARDVIERQRFVGMLVDEEHGLGRASRIAGR